MLQARTVTANMKTSIFIICKNSIDMAIPVAFPVWAQRGAGSCANGLKTIR